MSKESNYSEEDYLDEDPTLQSQQWTCISILTPNSIKDPEGNVIESGFTARGFKIRGVYATEEQAKKRCEDIRKFDKYHNLFIGPVGKWLPWDDDSSKVEESVYAEPKLNDMMKAYKDSQEKAMEYNEERKMKAHSDATKKKKQMAKEQASDKTVFTATEKVLDKNNIITSNMIDENLKAVNSKLEDLKEDSGSTVDEELQKARTLYDEMIKKYNIEKK